MQDKILKRDLVAEFYKSAGGKVTLSNLVVLEEEKDRRDGKIYVTRKFYNVDHSRNFGYIFHVSGGGGDRCVEVSGIYFVSGTPKIREKETTLVDPKDGPPWTGASTLAVRKRNRTRRLRALPKAFDLSEGQDLLDWLESNGIENEAVWCSICRDYFPGSDDWNLCEHCWWCDKTSTHSTPSERCGCKDRDECQGN